MTGKDSPSPSKSGTVTLQFKVWAPDFNRVNSRLFLLGSLKEMGAWNINEAVEAFPTPDLHVWKAEVKNLAPKSIFEWVWLKTRSDRMQVQWERTAKRNRIIDNFSGIIHSVYGEALEVFQQAATSVEIATFIKVEKDHVLMLTGDSPSTGMWDLASGVKAKEYPRQSGYWKALVSFDVWSNLTFKWAVVREKDKKLQVMEKQSHCIYGRPSCVRAVAPWSLPRVFVVDTNIGNDPLDSLTGRTDLIVSDRKLRLDEIRKWLNKANTGRTPSLVPLSQVPTPKHPKSQSTPTTTDSELARHAIAQMATKAILLPSQGPQAQQALRKPTVQPMVNLDEHSKQRQKSLTSTQKLAKQFNEEFNGSGTVDQIKGKGQTDAAKESGDACDWLQQFPWSVEVATANEAKCLVYRSDHDPVKLAGSSLIKSKVVGSKADVESLSTTGLDNLMISNTDSVPGSRKKDDPEGADDEDSGLYSISLSPNGPSGHDSTSTLVEAPNLGYDLITDDFSEIMNQRLLSPYFQTSMTLPVSDITTLRPNFEDVFSGSKSPEVPSENSKPEICGSSVDGDLVIEKSSRKDGTVKSMIKSMKCSDSFDTGIDCLYLDWLTKKVDSEEKFSRELAQIFETGDAFDSAPVKGRDDHHSEREITGKQTRAGKNKPCVVPKHTGQIFPEETIPFHEGESAPHFETPEIEHRRQMARILEEQWGGGAVHASSADAMLQNLHLGPSEGMAAFSFQAYQLDGGGDLWRECDTISKWAGYTNNELVNVVVKQPEREDRREVARMLEKRWGKMAARY